MQQVFRKLLNKPDLADVKFLIGSQKVEVYAHKLLLSTASEYFAKEFYPEEDLESTEYQGPNQMTEITIPEFEPEPFLRVLEFIYVRDLEIEDDDEVTGLLHLSEHFKIKDLTYFCLDYISKNVSKANWLKNYELAKQFNSQTLLDAIFSFVELHSSKLFPHNRALLPYPYELIKEIVSLEKLQMKEVDLFLQIIEWGKKQAQQSGNDIYEIVELLLPHIRLDVMSNEDLEIVFQSNFFNYGDLEDLIQENENSETTKFGRRGFTGKPREDIKVLVLCSDDRESYVNDAIDSIKSNGIQTVVHFNGRSAVPTIDQLMEYDVIFVYADYNWQNNSKTSDNVKEYVESGGGLVLCGAFALSTEHPSKDFLGEIVNGFVPLAKGRVIRNEKAQLGEFDENHPIMDGILSFNGGGSSFYVDTQEVYGGEVIARWSNGRPLIIEKKTTDDAGQIVALNIFPISELAFSTGWTRETDGAKLIANATEYAAQRSPHTMTNLDK